MVPRENSPKILRNILNWLNIGSDFEISIRELAEKIAKLWVLMEKYYGTIVNLTKKTKEELDNSQINKIE